MRTTTSVLGSRKVDRLVVDRKGLEMVRQKRFNTPGVAGPDVPCCESILHL
jgi:hypothetical protein